MLRRGKIDKIFCKKGVTLECKECGGFFKEKWATQTICAKCWRALNPEKDYVRQNKERQAHSGEINKYHKNNYNSGYRPFEEQMGVTDNDLLNDTAYIERVTKSSKESKTGNVRNEKEVSSNKTDTSISESRFEDSWEKTVDVDTLKERMNVVRKSGFDRNNFPINEPQPYLKKYC